MLQFMCQCVFPLCQKFVTAERHSQMMWCLITLLCYGSYVTHLLCSEHSDEDKTSLGTR
jgi:hypothetical protein